jgi:hypothetical protein
MHTTVNRQAATRYLPPLHNQLCGRRLRVQLHVDGHGSYGNVQHGALELVLRHQILCSGVLRLSDARDVEEHVFQGADAKVQLGDAQAILQGEGGVSRDGRMWRKGEGGGGVGARLLL